MTVREAIKEAMTHEMREDENVFLMGEDVGIFGGDLRYYSWYVRRVRTRTRN